MADRFFSRNIATLVVSINLLLTYSYFFGQKSIQRYLEGKIIITEHEEKPIDAIFLANLSTMIIHQIFAKKTCVM